MSFNAKQHKQCIFPSIVFIPDTMMERSIGPISFTLREIKISFFKCLKVTQSIRITETLKPKSEISDTVIPYVLI